MNTDAEKMIAVLSPAINEKCAELKEIKREKIQARLFMLLCIAALIIPPALVFFGLNLLAPFIPVAFISVCLLLLSPILFHQQGGHLYEQA